MVVAMGEGAGGGMNSRVPIDSRHSITISLSLGLSEASNDLPLSTGKRISRLCQRGCFAKIECFYFVRFRFEPDCTVFTATKTETGPPACPLSRS